MKILHAMQKHTKPFFSLEFFPPKAKEHMEEFYTCVGTLQKLNPLFASVTYGAGGSSQDSTFEIAAKIQQMGIEPMVHLTCVGASSEKISDFLQQLRNVGIDNILALRGDPPGGTNQEQEFDWNSGEFRYAEDLVRFVRRVDPQMGISVAGYPAPHPESPSFLSDRRYTMSKIQAGADFVVTQLFFDVREYFDFVDDLRRHNISTPIIPGILPVQSFAGIRRLLSLCGANIPGKLYLQLEDAHNKGGSEAVREVGMAFAVEQIRKLIDGGAPGIHLYTLNKDDLCLRIAQEVRDLIPSV